jgi:hypothetical protein
LSDEVDGESHAVVEEGMGVDNHPVLPPPDDGINMVDMSGEVPESLVVDNHSSSSQPGEVVENLTPPVIPSKQMGEGLTLDWHQALVVELDCQAEGLIDRSFDDDELGLCQVLRWEFDAGHRWIVYFPVQSGTALEEHYSSLPEVQA